MAGALPKLEVEAWPPVPQGRGYEGKEAGSQPWWNSPSEMWQQQAARCPGGRGRGRAQDTVARGLLFPVPRPQLPQNASLVLQVVGRERLRVPRESSRARLEGAGQQGEGQGEGPRRPAPRGLHPPP